MLYGPWREKTCLRGLRTTKAQTSLHISADWSVPLLLAFWKVSFLNLLQAKFQFSSWYLLLKRLHGSSLALSETTKTGLSRCGQYYKLYSPRSNWSLDVCNNCLANFQFLYEQISKKTSCMRTILACEQRRQRPACPSSQSDQRLWYLLSS